MKLLLVDALSAGQGSRKSSRDVIGAGPRTIAGVVEEFGIKPRIKTAEIFLEDYDNLENYDLILISGMTTDLKAVRRVIQKWRLVNEGPVIVGGPISSAPRDVLIRARGDLAVIGEGEQSIKELLELGLYKGQIPKIEETRNVPGIAYLYGGSVHLNGLRPVMTRKIYDSLKPSTSIIRDYPLYYAARVYVEVLRGCSNYIRSRDYSHTDTCIGCGRCIVGTLKERYYCPKGVPPGCGYCSVPSLYGPPKSRSVENICAEIQELFAEGVKRVVLSAPDFLDYGRDLLVEPEPLTDPRQPEPNYDAIEDLLSDLTEIDRLTERMASIMIENIKASLITDRVAKLLGRYLSGSSINIGFETGSKAHGLLLGRPSEPAENLRAITKLRKAGLKPYVYFIHGLPGQTPETVVRTVKAINQSVEKGAARIILYRFKPLPMSAFSKVQAAPPAVKDRLSGKIYRAALKANRGLKEEFMGRKLRVIIAEPYDRDRNLHVAYPLRHGPVVLVEEAEGRVGDVVDVVIERVISDRMVKGSLKYAIF